MAASAAAPDPMNNITLGMPTQYRKSIHSVKSRSRAARSDVETLTGSNGAYDNSEAMSQRVSNIALLNSKADQKVKLGNESRNSVVKIEVEGNRSPIMHHRFIIEE